MNNIKTKNLYIVYTPMHLYNVISIINKEDENYLLIIDNYTNLINNKLLNKSDFKQIFIIDDVSKVNKKYLIRTILKIKKFYRNFSYMNNVFLFLDNNLTGQIIISTFKEKLNSQIILIEDGIGLYLKKTSKYNLKMKEKLKNILNKVLFLNYRYISQGENLNVDKIYCNYPEILNKEAFHLNSIIKYKPIINIDNLEFDIVLLTQPFSEDGVISISEEIEFYKKILDDFKNYNIGIKLHPREKSCKYDFIKSYTNVSFIRNKSLPIEVFISSIKCKYIMSISSTAILNIRNMNKIYLFNLINLGSIDNTILQKFENNIDLFIPSNFKELKNIIEK